MSTGSLHELYYQLIAFGVREMFVIIELQVLSPYFLVFQMSHTYRASLPLGPYYTIRLNY